MTENKATLVIDGNTEQLAKKTEEGIKKGAKKGTDYAKERAKEVGEAVEKAGTKAGESIGKSFDKSISVLARGQVVISTIAQAIASASQKASELIAASAAKSEKRGNLALEASQAAARGGLDQGVISAFVNKASPVSQESRVSLVEALASSGQSFTGARLNELTSAFDTGAFTSNEVVTAAGSGASLDIQGRLSQLSPEARREIEVRRSLDAINAQGRGAGMDAARLGQALGQARDAADPASAIKRGVLQPLDRTGLGQLGVDVGNARDANAIYLREIANNTRGKLNMSGVQDSQ